ncbi:RusA family crossover junction endodeoxyribonuclease [Nocardia sp. NPDC050435]|uniref:RusA family crossover junction endodeoxyribonuclease n=1 Tax=Nocardia sp. NPDC050435 TaxID=3155040 RepID=UPI0034096444
MIVDFYVAGRAAPQGSKNLGRAGNMYESSRYLKPWRELIAYHAVAQQIPMIDGPVILGLGFVMTRPQRTPRTRPTPPATKRPDIEKLARGCADALTGIAFRDDAQVDRMPLAKRIAELGEEPGVRILIAPSDSGSLAEVVSSLYGLSLNPYCTTCLE